MEHAKQDAHEVPIGTGAQANHIEEEGGATLQKATPALRMACQEPASRSVWITKVSHAAQMSSDRTK